MTDSALAPAISYQERGTRVILDSPLKRRNGSSIDRIEKLDCALARCVQLATRRSRISRPTIPNPVSWVASLRASPCSDSWASALTPTSGANDAPRALRSRCGPPHISMPAMRLFPAFESCSRKHLRTLGDGRQRRRTNGSAAAERWCRPDLWSRSASSPALDWSHTQRRRRRRTAMEGRAPGKRATPRLTSGSASNPRTTLRSDEDRDAKVPGQSGVSDDDAGSDPYNRTGRFRRYVR